MSSILKALKKLEEEQAGQADRSGPPSGGQYVAPVKRRFGQGWLLIGAGAGIGLMLAGGTYLVSGQPKQVHPPSPGQTDVAVTGQTPPQEVVVSPAPLPAAIPRKAAVPAKPVTSPLTAQTGRQAAPTAARPVVEAAALPTPERISPGSSPAEQVEHVSVEHREIPAPGRQWAAPHLVVSDILPASGGERMAIVNDLPVMAGTMVENALVKEIRDREVLFVIDGKIVAVAVKAPR